MKVLFAAIALMALGACASSPVPLSNPLAPVQTAAARGQSVSWADGDSGRIDGRAFRLYGVDSGETGAVGTARGADCQAERDAGLRAKQGVMDWSVGRKVWISKSYGFDQYNREVVDIRVGNFSLKKYGLANGWYKEWNYEKGDSKPDWCTND